MVDTYALDPFLNHKFCVMVNDFGKINCTEVSGLGVDKEEVSYREGCDPLTMRKFFGMTTYENLVLKRGITTDASQFLDWEAEQKKTGKPLRKTIIVQVMDGAGNPARTYTVYKAWLKSIKFGDLNASSSEVYIETAEFCYEGLDVKVE